MSLWYYDLQPAARHSLDAAMVGFVPKMATKPVNKGRTVRPTVQTRPACDFVGVAKARAKSLGVPYVTAARDLARENPGLLAECHENTARQQERRQTIHDLKVENARLRRSK